MHADLVAGLKARPDSADVVVSADVLVYFGDLLPVFTAAGSALRPGGWLLGSVEMSRSVETFALAATGRYEHGEHYIRDALGRAGLVPGRATQTRLRFDRGEAVTGLVFSATKTGSS